MHKVLLYINFIQKKISYLIDKRFHKSVKTNYIIQLNHLGSFA
nr:MAG TPA: hypothetical protein [Caudoviricetes sp.]